MNFLDVGAIDKILGRGILQRFKGGSEPDPPSSAIRSTENMEYARKTLYPQIGNAMEGEGYGTPEFNKQHERGLYKGLRSAHLQAYGELKSTMHRTVNPKDSRVKDFMRASLGRANITAKDDIARGLRSQRVGDQDIGQSMAASSLGNEKRMGVDSAGMLNQALQQNMLNQQANGTFNTNVAAGIGQGAMDYYYAQKMA